MDSLGLKGVQMLLEFTSDNGVQVLPLVETDHDVRLVVSSRISLRGRSYLVQHVQRRSRIVTTNGYASEREVLAVMVSPLQHRNQRDWNFDFTWPEPTDEQRHPSGKPILDEGPRQTAVCG